MHIAFIGFGEAARALAKSLGQHDGTLEFSAYDILIGTESEAPIRAAAEAAGVRLATSPEETVAAADWIISAVTAASSFDAAQSVHEVVRGGQVYIDINSVSAGVKRRTANLIEASGATYVDMAVMSPVHPRAHRSPVLVAGAFGEELKARLKELQFDFDPVGPEPGMAATVKMVRSLFVKGLEAITVQAMVAAQQAGCLERVSASLAKSYPQFDWDRFLSYQFERVATHGTRRAAEMRESAVAMAELGFPEGEALALAIARLQDSVGELHLKLPSGTNPIDPISEVAAALASRNRKEVRR